MIVLDTHALLWWVSEPKKLSRTAVRLVRTALGRGELRASVFSAWELAMLVARRRVRLRCSVSDWLAEVESIEGFELVPVSGAIAIDAVQLPPPMHADPADRIIAATARALAARLVTADSKLRENPQLDTAW